MSLLLRVKALAQAIGADIKAINAKLAGVATGATKNSTDAQLRDRATHTGTQAVGTITGLGTASTRDVGTGSGQLMEVGVYGHGLARDIRRTDQNKTPQELIDTGTTFGYVESKKGGSSRALRMNNGSCATPPDQTALSAFNRVEFSKGGISYSWATSFETWSPWVDLLHTGNQLTLGETPATARSALGIFADTSGIMTDGSAALSNDMSGFLSQKTKIDMRESLGIGPEAEYSDAVKGLLECQSKAEIVRYLVGGSTFGFKGSGGQPFNQGSFARELPSSET